MSASDTTEGANNVGKFFVKTYYETLFKDPLSLYKLYKSESRFSRGTSSEAPTVARGVNEIKEQIENLKLNSPLVLLSVIDIQPSVFGSILISIVGSLRNGNEQTRPFNEVFVLAPQKPSGFYIYTHTFRFVDNFVDDFVKANPSGQESTLNSQEVNVDQKQEEPVREEKKPVERKEESRIKKPVASPKAVEEPVRSEPSPPVATKPAPAKKEEKPQADTPARAPAAQPASKPPAPSQPKTWRDIVNSGTPASVPAPAAASAPVKPITRPTVSKPAPVESAPAPSKPAASAQQAEKPKTTGHLQSPQKMVVVRNISPTSTSESIKKVLSKHGNILSAQLSGRMAFVEFENVSSVAKALAAEEPVIVDGVEVKLEAKRKEKSTKRTGTSGSPPSRNNKPRNAPRSGNLRDSDKPSN